MIWRSGSKMFYTNFDEFKASNTILLLSSGKWEMVYNSAYKGSVICEFIKGICIAHKFFFTQYLTIIVLRVFTLPCSTLTIIYVVITSTCSLLGLVWLCDCGLMGDVKIHQPRPLNTTVPKGWSTVRCPKPPEAVGTFQGLLTT